MNASSMRPNAITIQRRVQGGQSPTGAKAVSIATLNTGVPARIDMDPTGTMQWLVEGANFVQAAVLIVDGLDPSLFVDVAPGATLVVGGITYTVSADGLSAFPDLAYDDRVTDEKGSAYLVLAVNPYVVTRTLQAQIARGRAWA